MAEDSPGVSSDLEPAQPTSGGELLEPDHADRRGNHTVIRTTYQGPLPPAAELAAFERIQPGFAARVISWTEREQEHRHTCEKQALSAEIEGQREERSLQRRGQDRALAVALSAFGLAGLALWLDQPWIAGIIGSGVIGSLVTAFLAVRKSDDDEEKPSKEAQDDE